MRRSTPLPGRRLTVLALAAALTTTGLLAAPTASAAPRVASAAAVPHEQPPTGLTVNGLDRPADLEDLETPAFSWHLPAIARQSSYRVVVASSPQKAAAHEGDVWDSGEVDSADQTDVAYDGPALETSRRYYWTVQARDEQDRALRWAEPTWFGTSPGATWEGATPVWAPAPATRWTDYTLSARLTVGETAVGLRFRATDSNNSYMWQFRGADNRLVPHKQTNGAYATLGTAVNLPAGTLAVGTEATVQIQVAGSTITTRINGVQVDQRTDSSLAFGVVGVRTGNSESGRLDDVRVVSSSGTTLLDADFSGANPFACGSVSGGALQVPRAASCLVRGFAHDWVMLRKDVTLQDKPIAWATLNATGTDWKASRQYVFKAAIDGRFVGLGPTSPVGTETRFDGFDVTDRLEPGATSTISLIANSSNANARLLAQLRVQYADGSTQVVGTGSDWKVLSAGAVYPSPGSYGTSYFNAPREDLDARRFPTGFDRPGFDDSAWAAAEVRPAIAELRAAPMAKVQEQRRDAATISDKGDGRYVVDFGRTWMGGIAWDALGATEGSQVQVRFGQVLDAAGSVKYQTSATNTYLDTWTLREGDQHLETWGMRTFRYVEIVGATAPVTTETLKAVALVYPFDEDASAFASSSDNLEQVYALSKNTIEATNLNFYTDSWERERTNYEADAYLQQMSSLYLMDDLSLGRYSMDYFRINRTWPTEWPPYVVLAVHDAWRQTGSTDQVRDYYENLKTKLPSSRWLDAGTGLIRKTSGSNGCNSQTDCDIVDWPTSQRDGYVYRQHNTVINAIAYRALADMAAMAEAIGEDADAAAYAKQAADLRDAINATLYDAQAGAYDDGADANLVLTGHKSIHASAFALAFGVPEASERPRVAAFVKSRGMACSVYCAAFVVKGLYDGGDGQTALDLMTAEGTSSWMNMIRVGAGATMEAWDLSQKQNTSYSHPWAASPAFNVPSGLFGIQPLVAGYERVAIKPQPGSLEWGTIRTPTVRGSIGAAFRRDGDATTVVASVPGNTAATVSVPTRATEPTALWVDGARRTITPTDGFLVVPVGAGCHVLSPGADTDVDRLTSVCAQAPVAAPTVEAVVSAAGDDGWHGAGAELTLTATQPSADRTVEVQVDAGAWQPYTDPIALDAGTHTVAWRLVEGDTTVADDVLQVRVDDVAPTVEASVQGRTLALTAQDEASGVRTIEYRFGDEAWRRYASPVALDSAARTVTYRATDRAGNVSSAGSVEVPADASAPVVRRTPTIGGTARYRQRLTATTGTWSPSGVSASFQWLRDGRPIGGATGRTYVAGRADVGKRLSVRVTARLGGRAPGVATSAPTARVAKASSRTQVTASPRTVRSGRRVSVTIRVSGAGEQAAGVVRVGRTRLPAVTRRLSGGRVRISFVPPGTGRQKVTVRYGGSAVLLSSTASVRYRVR